MVANIGHMGINSCNDNGYEPRSLTNDINCAHWVLNQWYEQRNQEVNQECEPMGYCLTNGLSAFAKLMLMLMVLATVAL